MDKNLPERKSFRKIPTCLLHEFSYLLQKDSAGHHKPGHKHQSQTVTKSPKCFIHCIIQRLLLKLRSHPKGLGIVAFKIQGFISPGAVVSRQNAQIADIHHTIGIEITLSPGSARLTVIGCQDSQVTDIDTAVFIGIAGDLFLQSEVTTNKRSSSVVLEEVTLAAIEEDVHVVLRSADQDQSIILAGRADR
jgi:hypothetical protein